jgi:hypothetical protein
MSQGDAEIHPRAIPQGDPAIMKEMSLSVITERVDPSEMQGLQEKLRGAQTTVQSADAKVERLEETV